MVKNVFPNEEIRGIDWVRGIIHRHWCRLGMRVFELYLNQQHPPKNFVQIGYNEVASFYDSYWTQYMAFLSIEMLKKLDPIKEGDCLDLACGTGFVTQTLYEMTNGRITGVDVSEKMIGIAQQKYGETCQFIIEDAYHYLKKQPSQTYDCITCAWGLGYVTPLVIKEISRVLREGGKVGFIDNSIFSHWEFVLFLGCALAEQPSALMSYFEPHFFISAGTLAQRMWMNGLRIIDAWNGKKIFEVKNKATVMEQLTNSGVTAGILQLIDEAKKDKIIKRTSELLQKHYSSKEYIPITHRYIGVVGKKIKVLSA